MTAVTESTIRAEEEINLRKRGFFLEQNSDIAICMVLGVTLKNSICHIILGLLNGKHIHVNDIDYSSMSINFNSITNCHNICDNI